MKHHDNGGDDGFRIQKATEKHAGPIRGLVLRSGINPTALNWRRFLVALDERGELIGCGQVKPHADGTHELASIAVEPEWRGRGVARALIEALLAKHPGELYLMCQSSLEPLYTKFGFLKIERAQMPTFFRRVSKLAGILEYWSQRGAHLIVMHLPAHFS